MAEEAGRVDRKEGAKGGGNSQMECLGGTFPKQRRVTQLVYL